jgi:hypothetical protein
VVFDTLAAQLRTQLSLLTRELAAGLPKVNAVLKKAGQPQIVPSTAEPPAPASSSEEQE